MISAALLDTSFFLRFLNDEDPLFSNADNYFRFFLQSDIAMIISTISVAEYCVGGDLSELPLKNLQILPFNLLHSKRTGELARIAFERRKKGELKISSRNIIPNDTKLFAQADCEKTINIYLSSDTGSKKIFDQIKRETELKFQFVDLSVPYHETFSILPFIK